MAVCITPLNHIMETIITIWAYMQLEKDVISFRFLFFHYVFVSFEWLPYSLHSSTIICISIKDATCLIVTIKTGMMDLFGGITRYFIYIYDISYVLVSTDIKLTSFCLKEDYCKTSYKMLKRFGCKYMTNLIVNY